MKQKQLALNDTLRIAELEEGFDVTAGSRNGAAFARVVDRQRAKMKHIELSVVMERRENYDTSVQNAN